MCYIDLSWHLVKHLKVVSGCYVRAESVVFKLSLITGILYTINLISDPISRRICQIIGSLDQTLLLNLVSSDQNANDLDQTCRTSHGLSYTDLPEAIINWASFGSDSLRILIGYLICRYNHLGSNDYWVTRILTFVFRPFEFWFLSAIHVILSKQLTVWWARISLSKT